MSGGPRPAVFLTHFLSSRLTAGGLSEDLLKQRFLEWKHEGRHVRLFGRDAAGMAHHLHVRHVHLIPLNDPNPTTLARWNRDVAKGLRDRTSDRYLLYVDGTPAHGYLLLAIVNDPGAHRIWERGDFVAALERAADAFFHHGTLPAIAASAGPAAPGAAAPSEST